jgi:hypothetical protein
MPMGVARISLDLHARKGAPWSRRSMAARSRLTPAPHLWPLVTERVEPETAGPAIPDGSSAWEDLPRHPPVPVFERITVHHDP